MISFLLSEALIQVNILPILLSFVATAIATWILCRISKVLSIGHDRSQGVQKFHVIPTSRMGGIAIFLGFAVSAIALSVIAEFNLYSFWFLIAALPVWLAGLAEDLTHRVCPTFRLCMAIVSSALLIGTMGVFVNRTDVWLIDLLLSIPGVALCVTLLVVAGFTHSMNIVDGFHGLASGLAIITISSLAIIAWKVGDTLLLNMCATSLAVVISFFLFNWPKGAIFLGDAGAYLIGFWVVELGILLAMRNPQISPMAPVVAGLLPLIETLCSIYRRVFIKKSPVNQPDALHLHTLIYRRILHRHSLTYTADQLDSINAKVALFFWVPSAIFAGLACIFAESTDLQLILILIYFLIYNWVYMRIVRFNAPTFMKCIEYFRL